MNISTNLSVKLGQPKEIDLKSKLKHLIGKLNNRRETTLDTRKVSGKDIGRKKVKFQELKRNSDMQLSTLNRVLKHGLRT